MQFKILSVPSTGDPNLEEELNRFLRGHRVVSAHRELVRTDSGADWCFCIEYLLGPGSSGDKSGGRTRVDYRDVLSEEDFAVFARLRDLRKELAASEAIPVYAVCTNEQLAEIAKQRCATVTDLKQIEGFGEAKADKFGEAIVTAVKEVAEGRQT